MSVLPSLHGINLSNEEKLIRNDWFQSLCIYFLGSLATFLGYYLVLAIYLDFNSANSIIPTVFFSLIAVAISITILYYTAYLKFGFRWIGYFLVISLIRNIIEGIKELGDLFTISDPVIFFCFGILNLISISLFVYFWIHCKRLYKLNKLLRKRSPILIF